MSAENNYKVRLIPISSLAYGGDTASVRDSQVAFDVTPSFSETRSAEYAAVTPVHLPGAIQVYKHTNSRTFEVTAHLISRSVAEGWANMRNLQKLRGWLLPYFGQTNTITSSQQDMRNANSSSAYQQPTNQADADTLTQQRIQQQGVQLRGAPPDVLYLYAYSTSSNNLRGGGSPVNINRIPVVMTSLAITYPEDVDYIPIYDPKSAGPVSSTEPFPRKMDVSLSLTETHSPYEYEQFDLAKYKAGTLVNF